MSTMAKGAAAAHLNSPGVVRRFYTVIVFVLLTSLDNTAIGLVPPLISPISDGFGVPESAIGLVVGSAYLVAAFSAVGWAYLGDRHGRRWILVVGTLVWTAGTGATGAADGYLVFFLSK
ncbi:MFS transporter [Amycolatopsis sp. NBC_01307]|uniref:MFS transporter n=1 Tax=Amycolatopsis sp. NBC_01307 TaxID=2903561 RepID=UPI002E0D6054|nr:MFS transporter [Amycolatopsis sp. NBC_01307]